MIFFRSYILYIATAARFLKLGGMMLFRKTQNYLLTLRWPNLFCTFTVAYNYAKYYYCIQCWEFKQPTSGSDYD
jgi:hypothetical protein